MGTLMFDPLLIGHLSDTKLLFLHQRGGKQIKEARGINECVSPSDPPQECRREPMDCRRRSVKSSSEMLERPELDKHSSNTRFRWALGARYRTSRVWIRRVRDAPTANRTVNRSRSQRAPPSAATRMKARRARSASIMMARAGCPTAPEERSTLWLGIPQRNLGCPVYPPGSGGKADAEVFRRGPSAPTEKPASPKTPTSEVRG